MLPTVSRLNNLIKTIPQKSRHAQRLTFLVILDARLTAAISNHTL